jgi:hypothetical protein
MHRNPVRRGLVERSEQCKWSSFRFYAYGEEGPLHVDHDVPDREPGPLRQVRTEEMEGAGLRVVGQAGKLRRRRFGARKGNGV